MLNFVAGIEQITQNYAVMKKILFILLTAVFMSMPLQAQVKLGVKGGINLTNMSFSESINDNVESQMGFHIGPTLKVTVPVVGLSFDASALFDYRSAKAKDAGETIKETSLQIPVNIRYGVGLGSVANLFAFAGPQFGFNLGSKNKTIQENAAKWSLKDSNLSANFGVGATVMNNLQLTLSYNVALGKTGEVEIWDGIKNAYDSKASGKAHAWQVSAAYFF